MAFADGRRFGRLQWILGMHVLTLYQVSLFSHPSTGQWRDLEHVCLALRRGQGRVDRRASIRGERRVSRSRVLPRLRVHLNHSNFNVLCHTRGIHSMRPCATVAVPARNPSPDNSSPLRPPKGAMNSSAAIGEELNSTGMLPPLDLHFQQGQFQRPPPPQGCKCVLLRCIPRQTPVGPPAQRVQRAAAGPG